MEDEFAFPLLQDFHITQETIDKNISDNEASSDDGADYWTKAAQRLDSNMADIFNNAPDRRLLTDWEDDNDDDIDKDKMDFEQEFSLRLKRKRKGRRGPTKGIPRSVLSAIELQELGYANSAFLDGDYDSSLEICQRIVKTTPEAAEPYQTMAMVYEEFGDSEKCMLLYMVAAHLRPSDVMLWKRNAELAREAGLFDQAVYCLRRAVKADSQSFESYEDLAQLYIEMGKPGKAIQNLLRLFELKPTDIELAQDIAKLYVEVDDPAQAVLVFKGCLRNNGIMEDSAEGLSLDQVNILAELHMLNRNHSLALQILESVLNTNQEETPIDLRIKIAICYIHLGQPMEAAKHFACLDSFAVIDAADLFYDLAVAYYETEMWADAVNMFRIVVDTVENYQEPATWLRIAESYESSGDITSAASFYDKILYEYPSQLDVRFALADMYERAGNVDYATKARIITYKDMFSIEPEFSVEFNKVMNAFSRRKNVARRNVAMNALSAFEEHKEFITPIDAHYLMKQLEPLILTFNAHPKFFFVKKATIQNKRGRRARPKTFKVPSLPEELSQSEAGTEFVSESDREEPPIDSQNISENVLGLSVNEWFELNCLYCKISLAQTKLENEGVTESYTAPDEEVDFSRKAFLQMRKVSKSSLFGNHPSYREQIRLLNLGMAIHAGEFEVAYNHFRWFHQRSSVYPWATMLFQGLCPADEFPDEFTTSQASQKYFTRYLKQSHHKDPYLLTSLGFQLVINKNFINAVHFFGRAFHFLPNEPLLPLALGVAILQRAMQRKAVNRNFEIFQALAFFEKYKRMRQDGTAWKEQETYFNMGRVYSFLGLHTFAIGEYQYAIDVGKRMVIPPEYDLTKEAAHNMSFMYLHAGSELCALDAIDKYLVI